jgi:hypothetical protein
MQGAVNSLFDLREVLVQYFAFPRLFLALSTSGMHCWLLP